MMAQDLLNILGWKKEDLLNLQFIAYSYVKQGKYDIALTLLETLEVLDSNDLYTLQTLGAIYIEMKKFLIDIFMLVLIYQKILLYINYSCNSNNYFIFQVFINFFNFIIIF